MAKNLVIVESPAKAKTIEGFLGKDYTVKSSFGHVRDLVKKGLGVDVENGFVPSYEISDDKKQVINELMKLAKQAETVWLASDEDREGEAISWHLAETLNLNPKNTKRIVFHEITKPAILKAIETPRGIDHNLVDAQQARRILDRLVGFELSPVLWKKIKPSLSAGRVQSVAVRLIVEREREISDFKSTSAYRVIAVFRTESSAEIKAELNHRFKTYDEALNFVKHCTGASFSVANLEVKPAKRSPAAPFTTSTLQQEASRKLGFSVAQTMAVAQRLYESGKITYMRTDSTNLSELALKAAEKEIAGTFGKNYHQLRQYKTKNKGAQEAHEAIRPTYFEVQTLDGDNQERKLYELIWKRTIASQMADAQLERTTITIDVAKRQELFVAKGEVIKFDGFLKVYLESIDDEESEENSGLLPPVKLKEPLTLQSLDAAEKYAQHPPRYTEASLVKKLEELGIGRPSTYAPTISTVQNRGYVVKEDRQGYQRKIKSIFLSKGKINEEVKTENTGAEKSKLFPTDIGMVVNDFLVNHFEEILNYNFTATVEKQFDEIAEGELKWQQMLKKFYATFHKQVERTIETSDRATGERLIGIDPATGKNVYARIGRFGALIQIGETSETEKPRFSKLKPNQRLESISLEEALELFKLPRTVGTYENVEMTVSSGRFGPYIKHGDKFYSLKKEDDPMTIDTARAAELIEEKRKAEREKVIKTFKEDDTLQILNGRWGPYIAQGKNYYKIPKNTEPADLSFDECKAIIEQSAKKPEKKGKVATIKQEKKEEKPKEVKKAASKKPVATKAKSTKKTSTKKSKK